VLGQIYPGNCRNRNLPQAGHSVRLNTAGAGRVAFRDEVYGDFAMDLQREAGDFVLRRSDGIYAYHLAVVVDDELQGVDEVVRGADLLENTCLHLFLQQRLGFVSPRYLHIPLVNNIQGVKLSKQTGALAIDAANAPQLLLAALNHLAQQSDPELQQADPKEILAWAVAHWSPASIPAHPAASAENFEA
jgi:glutamyl-Q tRNA(Asp) synthetase